MSMGRASLKPSAPTPAGAAGIVVMIAAGLSLPAAVGAQAIVPPATAIAPHRPQQTGGPEQIGKEAAENDYPRFRWDDAPSLVLGEGTRIDFRGRFQLDRKGSEVPLSGEDEDSTIDIARRRIGIEGEVPISSTIRWNGSWGSSAIRGGMSTSTTSSSRSPR